MALQVIGAGFGRTGTTSLKTALEHLGYVKCHHMEEVIPSPRQVHYWARICAGEKVEWDDVYEGYAAAVDWPTAMFYQELAERYPDAKIVLSVRDPETWHRSASETIYPIGQAVPTWVAVLYPPVLKLRGIVFERIWGGVFDGRFEDKGHAIKVFNENIETCKRVIPPERLLVHEAKEGWEPLCAFLGKPVPDIPYPRANEAKKLKRAVVALRLLGYVPWAVLILAAVAAYIFLME